MHVPQSTYRLQLHPGFGFREAESVLGYLRDLGISDIYASPIFQTVPGSEHGYNIIRPDRLNPELGGEASFERLMEAVRANGLGWLQDIVPNHMAFASGNHRLMDLLEKGPRSAYSRHFDIDWDHPHPAWKGKVLAPFLGRRLQECIADSELRVGLDASGLHLAFYEIRFPLRPESVLRIVQQALQDLGREPPSGSQPGLSKAAGVCTRLENVLQSPADQAGDLEFIKKELRELQEEDSRFRQALEAVLERINASPGQLAAIASEQHYQLAYWRTATQEINYRRFFSINDLICLRLEEDRVFDDLHHFLFRLAESCGITGLRIDHLDGLLDPARYLARLRELFPETYLVAEKILEPEERLPQHWPVQGTTGYDFLFWVNNLFCQASKEPVFDDLSREFSEAQPCQGPEGAAEGKRFVLEREMAGELDNLVRSFQPLAAELLCGRDMASQRLKEALAEILVWFPVYRTYVARDRVEDTDPAYLRQALHRAETAAPHLQAELSCLSQVIDAALGEDGGQFSQRARHCLQRLQQLSGPLMAKGFEDTYLYRNSRLISLNEVGGKPDRFGISQGAFHAFMTERARHWPDSQNATATHDTKRGEDVRARINVLSELPEAWKEAVRSYAGINASAKARLGGNPVPEASEEYFLYQTLIGAWPFEAKHYPDFRSRIGDYMVKALREAKLRSSWLDPNTAYEGACLEFIQRILPDSGHNRFLEEFLPLQRRIAHHGIINSLAQTAIKLAAPGLPDIYQGCELWDLSLVDPDNRRAVDFELRSSWLARLSEDFARNAAQTLHDLLTRPQDGRIKLHLVHQGLLLRQEYATLFRHGEYLPVQCRGRYREHLVVFARHKDGQWCVVLVPRLTAHLVQEGDFPLGAQFWQDTSLVLPQEAPRAWTNPLEGRSIEAGEKELPVGEALQSFPVGLLVAG